MSTRTSLTVLFALLALTEAAEGQSVIKQLFGNQADRAVDDGMKGLGDLPKNVVKASEVAFGQAQREITTAGGNVFTTFKKAGTDTVTTVHKAGNDAFASYTKSFGDAAREAKHGFEEGVEAGKATAKFAERQVKSVETVAKKAERRIHEGKWVDAVWHLQTDYYKSSEDNFFKATQDSSLINMAASSAAATYGGPGGAAAYAAWAAYKATGDPNMAFRAAAMAAATAQAGAYTDKMPTGTAGEVLKKAAIAGAAGGIAVAAAGGDEDAIKKGFLQAGGAVLIQSSQEALKKYSPDVADAVQAVQCVSAKDAECFAQTTYAKEGAKLLQDKFGNPLESPTGKEAVSAWKGFNKVTEEGKKLAAVANISKLPGMEAIPVLDNKYVLTWTYREGQDVRHDVPSVVLTKVVEPPPFEYTVKYATSEVGLTTPVAAK